MPEKDEKSGEKRNPPAPATSKSAGLDAYAPFASGDPDAFIQKVRNENPDLDALLKAADKKARAALLAQMEWRSRQAVYTAIVALAFQLGKRSRHAEALALQRINYELTNSDPPDRLDSFLGHTQPRNVGDALTSIGETQEKMGEVSQALASYLDAEVQFQHDELLRRQAGVTKPCDFDRVFHTEDFRSENFALIAGIYGQLGETKLAAEYNEKARQYSRRGADPESRFESMLSAANGARIRGDLDYALGVYWEALKLALSLESSAITGKDVVEPLAATGKIYASLGLNRRALELFERARKINERAGHLGRLLQDHSHIAEVHAARGDKQSAIESYQKALVCASRRVTAEETGRTSLIWRINDESYQLVQLESAWPILLAMARLERGENRPVALDHLELAVNVIELLRKGIVQEELRVGYQAPSMEVYDEVIDLLAEEYEETRTPACLEKLFSTIERAKARVLYEMLADQPIAKPLHTPDELIQAEAILLQRIEELQKALEGSAGSSFEAIDQLDAANEQLSKVWEEITKSDPVEGPEYVSLRKAEVVSCEDIRETLQSSGNLRIVIVNYYLARGRLISLCLFSDTPELRYHSEKVDRDNVRFLALVNPEDPPSADLRLPYWVLDFPSITVSPIVDAVAGYDVVCLAPHDVLHSLPLHAFPVGPDQKPLAEHSTTTYVPSASILRFTLRRRKPNVGNSLIVGNPDRPDQSPIPHSEAEALKVASLLHSEAITGAAATRANVIEKGAHAEYLHLACHCKFSREDPLDSALMLTGGDLTARDIFSWRLNPELVVLSACESGVSKLQAGDELIGLVRALLFSGTPAVVVSLWNAYDGSAAELMEDFYRAHINGKKPMALSLAEAQRAQIRKGGAAAQWAPFILIGDWR